MNKNNFVIFYLIATLFYVASIITFVMHKNSMGMMWLCLGSTFLCLGSVQINKNKDDSRKDGKKDESIND